VGECVIQPSNFGGESPLSVAKNAILLPFDGRYQDLVRKWINQPDVRAGTGTRGPVSDYEHANWYENLMQDPTRCAFLIGHQADESTSPVGLTGLSRINLHSRSAEFWIYMGEETFRRRGLASAGTILMLGFGFDTLGLHRIYLQVMENNLPALRLYSKLGFRREGLAREHAFSAGRYLNMVQFSILDREFHELSGLNGG